MSYRDWRLRVQDMLKAIPRIRRYTAGMDYEAFAADDLTVDAVIRNVEIVGEASKYVPARITRRHGEIPWEPLRTFRNFLAHEYFGVDRRVLWETVTRDLPPLEPRFRKLMEEPDRRPPSKYRRKKERQAL